MEKLPIRKRPPLGSEYRLTGEDYSKAARSLWNSIQAYKKGGDQAMREYLHQEMLDEIKAENALKAEKENGDPNAE